MPPLVISSQSMHLGVLAAASHAVATQAMFVVFYKPRPMVMERAGWILVCSKFEA
ncbi:hypothetical protein I3843_15G100600 [Carya illinoinensis]|nr:hypothetical protein I3843_15G100600 [Carya illinoinensis]